MGAMSSRERILAARQGIAANRSKGVKPYKFKAGETSFRILPMSDDRAAPFERKYAKIYLKGFDGKLITSIIDTQLTYDAPSDPIRELVFAAMKQAPDEDTKKHYRDMLQNTRYVFNALILDDKDQNPTEPVIIEVSETAFDTIMAQFLVWSEEDENYDLAALDTGHVFKVDKTGAGMETRYNFQVTPKKAPLPAKILDKVIDLDAWIKAQHDGQLTGALEAIGRINGSIGITTSVPSNVAQIGASAAATAAAAIADKSAQQGVSAAAVTTLIEPEVEDAVVEAVVEETPPFETEAAVSDDDVTAALASVAAAEATPAETPAATAGAGDLDLEDILAQLNG